MLPKAILFDLDDTLISAYNRPDRAWLAIAHEFSAELHPFQPDEAAAAINHAADVFWADAERHRAPATAPRALRAPQGSRASTPQ